MARPITVTVGGLASASATKLGLSQKAAIAGTNYFVLNGASGSFVANSVCASQTPGGAGALVLNGTLASSVQTGTAVAYLPAASRLYITGGSNESTKTFTVVGYVFTAGGGPVAVKEVITGPNASTVSSINQYLQVISITVSAATTGAITVGHYGTATQDYARQVIITSAGDDAAISFTITGTDWNNSVISETVAGTTASVSTSVLSYKTVTSITSSGAVASTVTIGTNTVASSPWIRFDDYSANAQVAMQINVTGTVSYTVQSSMDDPNDISRNIYGNPAGVVWVNSSDTALVAASTTLAGVFAIAPLWARVVLNSGTGSFTATMRQVYTGRG